MAQRPRFSALVILTLAVGIGANTAVFSIFDAVLLRPLPFRDPGRLINIWESPAKQLDSTGIWNSYRDLLSWTHGSKTVEDLAAYSWVNAQPVLRGRGAPREVFAPQVTPNFFSLLGASAQIGRIFSTQDKMGDHLVVLSHNFWQTEFGQNPAVIGMTLDLDRTPYTVIGVMPARFVFYPKAMAMWRLISPEARFVQDPNDHSVVIFGRLRPGVRIERAQQELTAIRANKNKAAPDGVAEFVPVVHDLQENFTWLTGRSLRRTLILLLGSVVFLLLIGCLNVANLLLTRGAERRHEMAIRAALGSGRARLVQQLLTEALVLSCIGVSLGVALAAAAVHYVRVSNPVELPPGNPIAVDLRVLAFSAALGVLATLVAGLMPAWRATRVDLNDALKTATRGSSTVSGSMARWLVVFETSLSLMLLVGAGLMVQSVNRRANASLGFRPDHLAFLNVDLPKESYSKPEQEIQFFDRLTDRVRNLRSVQEVAISSSLPLYGMGNEVVVVEGRPAPPQDVTYGDCGEETISPGYFRTMQIPLLRGRDFDVMDRAGSETVAIVNLAFVDRYFLHESPIGRHIKVGTPINKQPWLTIVGVVGDTKGVTVMKEMALETGPNLYHPFAQHPDNARTVLVRYIGDSHGLAADVPAQVTALDGNLPVGKAEFIADLLSDNLKYPTFRANILALFASLGLLLATIGLYGVISQAVVGRTREIGIRMALGATQGQVLGFIARQGIRVITLGIGFGLLGAMMLSRMLTSLLYEVRPTDPMILLSVTLALSGVSAIAIYVPAHRAAKLNPTAAIRYE
jgi:putative ABC transport system permease protein